MPVSDRGSHPIPKGIDYDDDFQRLLKKQYIPRTDFERDLDPYLPTPEERDRLFKKPYRPRPLPPSNPRVPKVPRRLPPVPGLGIPGLGGRLGNLAPYLPNPWLPGPRPFMPTWFNMYGPCMLMQSNIEFYRWTLTAVTSASCISGQAQGGGPTGAPGENLGADAAWNITIPAMGSGYQKRGYWGMYNVSGSIWRGQHRLSIEKAAYQAPYVYTPATPAIQTFPTPIPSISPMPDPNNWHVTINPAPPDAGQPAGAPLAPPVGDPLGPGGGGSFVTETPQGPIAVAIIEPGTKPQPGKLGPVAPPGVGVRETGKLRGSARFGRLLFKVLDEVSESCEIVDSLYDALPNDVKKAAAKKAGYVWSPSAKKYVLPGDGSLTASDNTTDAFRGQTSGSRAFVDQFGQYGLSGCDWKGQALYDHFDKLDVCGGLQNVVKNILEDHIHGVKERYRPKNTVNALADADKEFGLQVNQLLDELVDLCPK